MIERLQNLKNRWFPPPEKPKREYGSSVSKALEEKLKIGIMHAEDLRDELIRDPENETIKTNVADYKVGMIMNKDYEIGDFDSLPKDDHYKIADDLVRHIRQIMGENPFAQDLKITKLIFMENGILNINSIKEKYKPHKAEKEAEICQDLGPDATIINYLVKINNRWLMKFTTFTYTRSFKYIDRAGIVLIPIITEEDLVILNKNPKRRE